MHAELLARQVPGAAVATVYDAHAATRADAVGAELGVPSPAAADELLAAPDVDAVAICTSTDTHADLIVAAAARGQGDLLREAGLAGPRPRSTARWPPCEAAGVPFQIGFNRRFDPAHASVARRGRRRHDRRAAPRAHHQPRPRPAAAGVRPRSGGIFLDMTIHDFDMARYVTGSEVVEVFARGAVRVDPAFAEAGDVDTAVVMLDARRTAA